MLRIRQWLVLMTWTLPFLWAGVGMTLRRAVDAGWWYEPARSNPEGRLRGALQGLAAGLLLGAGMVAVRAVRRCEFSTGAFVEPITAWEPPGRLAFDVASQPAPMTEWSPCAGLSPPHLSRSFRTRRGEFRMRALPGGRT